MIEKHPFGRTGHQSTRTLFGAAAFSRVTQEEADRTMELLLRYGVNHIDTAASYGDSELRAAVEARDEGLVRFIGVTGHGTSVARMHRRALERFDFDSVLLPYDYPMMQNPQYAADFEALAAVCQERNVAVQTIKAITLGPWGDKPHD